MSDKLKGLRNFAQIFNSFRLYPTNFDLERALGKGIKAIRSIVEDYHKAREEHPDLPELIWRREDTGQAIPVPRRALAQLDAFRIDRERVKKAKGVIVTSAQFGSNIHKGFWKALKIYAEYRGFVLVVLPIKYGPVQFINGRYTSTFPDELNGYVLLENLMLGKDRIQLNVFRMRPTLERFLTDSVCEVGGNVSQVYAAPVIELEHRMLVDDGYPKAIMTAGAITYPNYLVDKLGQQDRTAELATQNHTFGAVVIEFTSQHHHFRQLIPNSKGEFYDIDPVNGGARWFTSKGHVHKPQAVESLVCGDWHTGKTCPEVRRQTFGANSIVDRLNPSNIVLHDFIDGDSVSHYEQYQSTRRAWKAPRQYDSMEIELKQGITELEWMRSHAPGALFHMVASNHPEFLTEYIEEMRWVKDDINLAFGARMFASMVGDLERRNPKKVEAIAVDPVVAYFREHCPWVNSLERTDKLLLGNKQILCSMHGDVGTRGAPTRSLKEFRKMNKAVILGHNHTGTIWGPVWRVGTSTPRMQFYVTTPSTQWTNTHCAIFDNGQRMLLNIVGKAWHGYDLKKVSVKHAA